MGERPAVPEQRLARDVRAARPPPGAAPPPARRPWRACVRSRSRCAAALRAASPSTTSRFAPALSSSRTTRTARSALARRAQAARRGAASSLRGDGDHAIAGGRSGAGRSSRSTRAPDTCARRWTASRSGSRRRSTSASSRDRYACSFRRAFSTSAMWNASSCGGGTRPGAPSEARRRRRSARPLRRSPTQRSRGSSSRARPRRARRSDRSRSISSCG